MKPITYLIPRTLLAKAGKVLQPAEQVRFVTGIKLPDGTIALTELLPTPADRSITHATPTPACVAQLHHRMLDLGQDIEAQFHSHPGTQAAATRPSRTDTNTARRWENGAPFLGAIFSSDGHYVRFFNYKQESTIHIYGTAYTQLEPHLFELHDHPVPTGDVTACLDHGSTGTPPVVEPTTDHEQ